MSRVPERVSDRVGGWVDAALRLASPAEEVLWEVCPLVAPPASGMPSPNVVQHVVSIWTKGALIGQWDVSSFTVTNAHTATEDQVADVVTKIAEQARAKRSSDLASGNGRVPPQFPQGPPITGAGP